MSTMLPPINVFNLGGIWEYIYYIPNPSSQVATTFALEVGQAFIGPQIRDGFLYVPLGPSQVFATGMLTPSSPVDHGGADDYFFFNAAGDVIGSGNVLVPDHYPTPIPDSASCLALGIAVLLLVFRSRITNHSASA